MPMGIDDYLLPSSLLDCRFECVIKKSNVGTSLFMLCYELSEHVHTLIYVRVPSLFRNRPGNCPDDGKANISDRYTLRCVLVRRLRRSPSAGASLGVRHTNVVVVDYAVSVKAPPSRLTARARDTLEHERR
ncbi:hypothetical protein EVAR_76742_1 [Eumeta japonica]|uniref:Uncharacterized protein n=1 Tax=Eumeta variegata TaxID=151549 RepID=A0A4C1SVR7_EUMVA|nr:hypothetical protein EVAR_76742_1 [Eumeta japonica]